MSLVDVARRRTCFVVASDRFDGTAMPSRPLKSSGRDLRSCAASARFGRHGYFMRLIGLENLRQYLRREVDRAGGQVAWAKHAGLHPSTVNKVLNEQRMPGRRLLAALNLRKVVAYQRVG
jgi:hypothetical protein